MAKVMRTTAGLRDTLFDELDRLNDGTSTPQKASAKARLAMTIVQASRLDMEYDRFVSGNGSELKAKTVRSLQLGRAA